MDRYTEVCTDTYLTIVNHFPWAVISPSIHRVLAHSAELMLMNGSHGLGSKSEEGLERLNKSIRRLREHGARKCSIYDNLVDVLRHMWRRSDPLIVDLYREKNNRRTKIMPSSEISNLVQSMFKGLISDDENED